jgi:hypothetical protein
LGAAQVCPQSSFFASFVNLEVFDEASRTRRRILKQAMSQATDYTTWETAAHELDVLEGICSIITRLFMTVRRRQGGLEMGEGN